MHGDARANKLKQKYHENSSERRVEYCPPPDTQLEKFIREVCDRMDQPQLNESSITKMRQGFGQFIKIVIAITAKQANERRLR